MENLQNLLKMKENEIEKLNNIRNTLKRKVVELNDAVSLKDIKITSLKEDLQEQIALNEELKVQLEKVPSSRATSSSAVGQTVPGSNEEVIRLLDRIVDTLDVHGKDISQIRQQLDNLPGGLQTAAPQASAPGRPSQYSQPSAIPSRVNTVDRPNLRDRLKPAPSGDNRSADSVPSLPKAASNKSKMVPPIVNVKKIQNIDKESAKAPPIPDRPPRNQMAPAPEEYGGDEYGGNVNTASEQYPPAPGVVPQPAKSGPPSSSGMPMGQYGVPTIPYPEDGMIKCPKCGGKSIQEMENRKKIVMFNPRKYGKKYGCKDCRTEWDYEY